MFSRMKGRKSEAQTSQARTGTDDSHNQLEEAVGDVRELMLANENLKAQLGAQSEALKKAEAEHSCAMASAVSLQACLKESEEQVSTLRTGFISLDEKNATLQQEHASLQNELHDCSRRLEAAEAEKSRLANHARDLETQVGELKAEQEKVWAGALTDKQHDSMGTSTSQADSAVIEGRALDSDGETHEMLSKLHEQLQTLRSDNERLQAELDAAQHSNDDLVQELDKASEMVRTKDAELSAAAALAQEVAKAQQRLQADLLTAREEKTLMAQVIAWQASPWRRSFLLVLVLLPVPPNCFLCLPSGD